MVSESANCRSGRLRPSGRRTITILLTRASGRMLKRANLRVSAVARFVLADGPRIQSTRDYWITIGGR
jgi:hypothetical protein